MLSRGGSFVAYWSSGLKVLPTHSLNQAALTEADLLRAVRRGVQPSVRAVRFEWGPPMPEWTAFNHVNSFAWASDTDLLLWRANECGPVLVPLGDPPLYVPRPENVRELPFDRVIESVGMGWEGHQCRIVRLHTRSDREVQFTVELTQGERRETALVTWDLRDARAENWIRTIERDEPVAEGMASSGEPSILERDDDEGLKRVTISWSDRRPVDVLTDGDAIAATADHLYMLRHGAADTLGVDQYSFANGTWKTFARDGAADTATVFWHGGNVLGYALYPELDWTFLSSVGDWQQRIDRYLQMFGDHAQVSIVDALPDHRAIVRVSPDDRPPVYFYDRGRDVKPLAIPLEIPWNPSSPVARAKRVDIPGRDGQTLPSYLYEPERTGPGALILWVHGGPASPFMPSYEPTIHLLTDRGYAVLAVNFRGSNGFGLKFMRAGEGHWHDAVQNDLDDAAAWAVAHRVANPGKIGIIGASFGGYAILMGLSRPSPFRCGVALNAPTDWQQLNDDPVARPWLGYPDDSSRRAASAVARVESMDRPLLLIQGQDDRTVRLGHAHEYANALRRRARPFTFAIAPGEGHDPSPEAWRASALLMERFFAECLGGHEQAPTLKERADLAKRIVAYDVTPELSSLLAVPRDWRPIPLPAAADFAGATLTRLSDTKFLLLGGRTTGGAELLDVNEHVAAWTRGSNAHVGRTHHTATLLDDGRVLVVGGVDENGHLLDAVELYDPRAARWTRGSPLRAPRAKHVATKLTDGRVVIVGGDGDERDPPTPLGDVDAFDPGTGRWEHLLSLSPAPGAQSWPAQAPGVLATERGALVIDKWDNHQEERNLDEWEESPTYAWLERGGAWRIPKIGDERPWRSRHPRSLWNLRGSRFFGTSETGELWTGRLADMPSGWTSVPERDLGFIRALLQLKDGRLLIANANEVLLTTSPFAENGWGDEGPCVERVAKFDDLFGSTASWVDLWELRDDRVLVVAYGVGAGLLTPPALRHASASASAS